jgi:cullin-associated NEDD8-dissociated protein 1
VDLGPFKHKYDDGIPIRKAAFALIDSLVEKLSSRLDNGAIIEAAIRGLDDPAEECMILCLHILGRLTLIAPTLVLSCIDGIVEAFDKQV